MVRAEGISKTYRLGEYLGFARTVARLRGRGKSTGQPSFEALDGVSFSIGAGECFGLVGGNGSGKSTVLQILSGITLPSAGHMEVRGKVLPLLAVGTSFHPELTGRENVMLFGTILGVERETILERMDEIAHFAEIERHMDTPNKRYSDGMQARLSFAVAMLFPAHIYIFDEVLAVVDGEFRARCLREIDNFVRNGRTVLFVSHDLDQVRKLCDRVMWMDEGKVHQLGETNEVLEAYERAAIRP